MSAHQPRAKGLVITCGCCGMAVRFLAGKSATKHRRDILDSVRDHMRGRPHERPTHVLAWYTTKCACASPIPIDRMTGSWCARCEGVIAPRFFEGERDPKTVQLDA